MDYLNMSEEQVSAILREIDQFRKENKDDHNRIEGHAKHTNGTVADLVEWKIQVKMALKIMGALIGLVVVPVLVNIIIGMIHKYF